MSTVDRPHVPHEFQPFDDAYFGIDRGHRRAGEEFLRLDRERDWSDTRQRDEDITGSIVEAGDRQFTEYAQQDLTDLSGGFDPGGY
ncbi:MULTISPECIES: hypothetical protein [unclassified Crossiella]|uniref:hypothetical protein n=1 Tax=unclassified Crossiella TaxID=2620835 RepID=UPI001FFF33FA|nr:MULTISPECIES: hypothetical protein [unclassified Crossiella]MCK2240662.1 hypothetical protein [Crossiella sp. S99.2]MCK2252887.1 hypothetical protein [Crossiella sp. S99.1]